MLVQLAGILALSASLLFYKRPASNTTLRGKANGRLEIRQGESWREVERISVNMTTPLVTMFRISSVEKAHCRYLVVFPDSMPGANFRRFRVWIRWLTNSEKEKGNRGDELRLN